MGPNLPRCGREEGSDKRENCENHNGEWVDGECDFYENQMKKDWEVDEENFYKEVCEDEVKESDECKKYVNMFTKIISIYLNQIHACSRII